MLDGNFTSNVFIFWPGEELLFGLALYQENSSRKNPQYPGLGQNSTRPSMSRSSPYGKSMTPSGGRSI